MSRVRTYPELVADAKMLHQGRVVPLADSIMYATAKQYRATVCTVDAHLADLPGVRYMAKRP